MKGCPHCQRELDDAQFSVKRNGKLASWCRDCTREASRRWEKQGPTHSQRRGPHAADREADPLNLALREFRIVGSCADLPTVPAGLVWRIAA